MANIFAGIGVIQGVGSTTATALGTCVIKSRDYHRKGKKIELMDAYGNQTGLVYTQIMQDATIEYYPTSATLTGSFAVTMPNVGDKITITSADIPFSGSNWYVNGASLKNTNEDYVIISVEVSQYPNIS